LTMKPCSRPFERLWRVESDRVHARDAGGSLWELSKISRVVIEFLMNADSNNS
jgi:hypothetical protein